MPRAPTAFCGSSTATLHVACRGPDATVRLVGVDTPETVHPIRRVYVGTDWSQDTRDRYGRLLAYLWLPAGKLVNLDLIRQGFAHEYTYDVAQASGAVPDGEGNARMTETPIRASRRSLSLAAPALCRTYAPRTRVRLVPRLRQLRIVCES